MFSFYGNLAKTNRPFALALIAGTKGSSPQRAGAKAIFFGDGTQAGTLGGGCLEAEVHARAKKALLRNQPEEFNIVLDHDFGWDDGLICGGSVNGLILPHAERNLDLWRALAAPAAPICWGIRDDYSITRIQKGETGPWRYRETVSPPVELWIAGSGHVAQAVASLARQLEFAVTIFDDRPELANPDFFPADVKLRVAGWHDLLKIRPPAAPVFGLIVTRGHQHDALVLSEWIRLPFEFLGMIGSRRKARIMREQFLKDHFVTPEQFDRIACPVGIDIGAVGTHEIAVSILAQLIQKRAAMPK